jgi:hypothetical protein
VTDLETNKANVTAFYELMFNACQPREASPRGNACRLAIWVTIPILTDQMRVIQSVLNAGNF